MVAYTATTTTPTNTAAVNATASATRMKRPTHRLLALVTQLRQRYRSQTAGVAGSTPARGTTGYGVMYAAPNSHAEHAVNSIMPASIATTVRKTRTPMGHELIRIASRYEPPLAGATRKYT